MNDGLTDAFRHNSWATASLVAASRHLPKEKLASTATGTYGDVVGTLNHLVLADAGYLRRLSGLEPSWLKAWEETSDLEELASRVEESARNWETFLSEPVDAERPILLDQGTYEAKAGMGAAARSAGMADDGPDVGVASAAHRPQLALLVQGVDRRGLLRDMTAVIAAHDGDISEIEILERGERSRVFWEIDAVRDEAALEAALLEIDGVDSVQRLPTMYEVYGKRIIVVGGGAQVGQVAVGAVGEADRHNIRGEKISVDTIPIVGETNLADAVRAVARLPRAAAVVLAGSLMGGEIAEAVDEVREAGVLVVSLNMAGSVPDHADLVVTDPLQAGVMTVMAVASTASFDVSRANHRRY